MQVKWNFPSRQFGTLLLQVVVYCVVVFGIKFFTSIDTTLFQILFVLSIYPFVAMLYDWHYAKKPNDPSYKSMYWLHQMCEDIGWAIGKIYTVIKQHAVLVFVTLVIYLGGMYLIPKIIFSDIWGLDTKTQNIVSILAPVVAQVWTLIVYVSLLFVWIMVTFKYSRIVYAVMEQHFNTIKSYGLSIPYVHRGGKCHIEVDALLDMLAECRHEKASEMYILVKDNYILLSNIGYHPFGFPNARCYNKQLAQ